MNENGQLLLQKELEELIIKVENPQKILECGAKEFVKDLTKLSKPKSKIRARGYTHLIDCFSYEKSRHIKGEIEVLWGKYYGPFVENGTQHGKVKIKSQPHLKPTFTKNENKYYSLMIKNIGLNK